VHQPEPGPAVGQLAVAAVGLAPRLEQRHDRSPLVLQQPVQRMPTRSPVGQLSGRAANEPAAAPHMIEPEQVSCAPGRPAALDGVVDQLEQAGLDVLVHPRRDRAGGQPQRAFPACRCSATACSATVARSRSTSAFAAANAASCAD
jgi:hypothetical protein